MNVLEAERTFAALVDRVYVEGITVELERDDKVIARLSPSVPRSPLKVRDLTSFLRTLPALDEDAADFAADVRAIRTEFPAEKNPWD